VLLSLGVASLTVMAAGFALWNREPGETRRVARFTHVLPVEQTFTAAGQPLVAVSPDGTRIVYVANQRLYLRHLGEIDARPIEGTDGEDPASPFLSPDGGWVAFWSATDRRLKKIPIDGGAPIALCDAGPVFGASWGADDTIVFGQARGVMRMAAAGGASELIVEAAPGEQVHGPEILPDGRTLLYTVTSATGTPRWDEAEVVLRFLDTGETKVVLRGSDARYVPSGHLVYALATTLFAVPFDLTLLETTGEPVPVVEGVRRAGAQTSQTPPTPPIMTGSANYAVSQEGILVYVPGPRAMPVERSLLTVDLNGHVTALTGELRDYAGPRFSPDGRRIAVTVADPGAGTHIWIVDVDSGRETQLTFDGTNLLAVWSPDGRTLVFRSNRDGSLGLYRQPVDGTGSAERIMDGSVLPGNVSPDGTLVFQTVGNEDTGRDIWTASLADGQASEFLATSANERSPVFSPDGRWIAYVSNESGRDEVYVRPYPAEDAVVTRVSSGGGLEPVWSPDGSELYYRNLSLGQMAAAIRTAPRLAPQRRRELFSLASRFQRSGDTSMYDVQPGGGNFVMVSSAVDRVERTTTASFRQLNIVLNWFEELEARAPAPARR